MIELRYVRESRNQLRANLGDLRELAHSIQIHGLLQPILVRPVGSYFEVVAGNRRLEACRKLRMSLLPCVVHSLDDKSAYEISLIENVHRKTLTVVEEARAYQKYIEEKGWGSLAQLAIKIGKSESYVSHRISLLRLPPEILEKLERGMISQGLAQELLWTDNSELQIRLTDEYSGKGLSTREAREIVRRARERDEETSISDDGENEVFHGDPIPQKLPPDDAILKKASLIMRITMVRLDSLIENTEKGSTRDFLMTTRFRLHQIIDETIKRRKMY